MVELVKLITGIFFLEELFVAIIYPTKQRPIFIYTAQVPGKVFANAIASIKLSINRYTFDMSTTFPAFVTFKHQQNTNLLLGSAMKESMSLWLPRGELNFNRSYIVRKP